MLALNTWLHQLFFLILKSNFHSDSKFQFGGLFRIKSSARQDRACNFKVSINVFFLCVCLCEQNDFN